MERLIFNILGILMVALGIVGIVLPVLPTTPFFLLALWFFGRGSSRLRKWLLSNKLFGNYIRNYRSGRGVPLRVKAWTLALLWATIGFSAWRVDPIWLKISLLIVAIAVTAHILLLGRRKVVVLIPTVVEASGIPDAVIGGVGMAEISAALSKILRRRPRMVVLAGISGAYPDSGLKVGDCVLVISERVGGLPAAYEKRYECPWAEPFSLPKVAGITVQNTTRNERGNAVENMEGAVFFAMCHAAGVKFLELRAVSNMTTDSREDWRVDEAVTALAAAIERVFDEIEA